MSTLLANDFKLGEEQIRGAGEIGNILEGADLEGADAGGAAAKLLEQQLSNIIGFLTLLGAVFFIINFFTAAFAWLRSGDDKGAIDKAQQKMVNSAIGLFIMVMAIGIIGIIGGVIGVDILNPSGIFENLVPNGASVPTGTWI